MAKSPKILRLTPAHRVSITTSRRYAVVAIVDDKAQWLRYSSNLKSAQQKYDEETKTNPNVWLLDTLKDDPVIQTSYSPIPKDEIDKQVKLRKKKEATRAVKVARVAKECDCGCKEMTLGGNYRPGHDARHKSALVKAAIGGDESALRVLGDKGWLRFLEKSQAVVNRGGKPSRSRREIVKDAEDKARETIKRLDLMKRASQVLVDQGRYKKGQEGYVEITADNAQGIIDGII